MNKAAIFHFCGGSFAFPVAENRLKIRLKAARGDLQEVKVVYGSRYPRDGSEPHQVKDLQLVARDEESDYFAGEIELEDARFRYHFYLSDGQEAYWFNEKGFSKERPQGFKAGFFQYPLINPGNIFQTPDWVKDAVFYQIFPERFYNGNQENDPPGTAEWGGKPGRDSFFGGDLEGIIQKLDYLEELGINALYLTPIFKSSSNHKYNIDDYYQIDPHFGDLTVAKKLVQEAHRRGIKVVLDAVFNHCGYDFFAFKDVREKGEKSPYLDWFAIDDLPLKTTPPLNYRTFANDVVNMPKLMTHNPEVKKYLLEVTAYWMKELKIDGWRLDVADEVEHEFWRDFRRLVKSINPAAYIVGEVWHDSQEWLRGDEYDAVMNYPFAEALYDFFARSKIGPREFDARLSKNRMNYQDEVNLSMLNLLDSHDTPRLLHYFAGNKKALKLAVLFQFTYLGAPMLYYGDEIGLEGGPDPDCRRCMCWEREKQDRELWEYYQKLIKIRQDLVSLRRGDFSTLLLDEPRNIYAFKRSYQGEKTYIIINNSPVSQKLELKLKELAADKVRDYLSQTCYFIKDGVLKLILPAYTAVILVPAG